MKRNGKEESPSSRMTSILPKINHSIKAKIELTVNEEITSREDIKVRFVAVSQCDTFIKYSWMARLSCLWFSEVGERLVYVPLRVYQHLQLTIHMMSLVPIKHTHILILMKNLANYRNLK